ncbi:MAG TPA: DUF4365 domain-containing protein [Micromonosporaceae bacterium]|nr:DUF4365 domain-containing protein [Micromonosporaceae bacterium]
MPQQVIRDDIATLGSNGAKARFGVAYVRAICSEAGVGFRETAPDEDVLAVDCHVEFAAAAARVQVKCTGQFRIDGGPTATWTTEDRWWRRWHKSRVPVYFVIVIVDPDVRPGWLDHQPIGTLYRAAAFWRRVDQLSTVTNLQVSKSQRLTVNTLHEWCADVDACFTKQVEDK